MFRCWWVGLGILRIGDREGVGVVGWRRLCLDRIWEIFLQDHEQIFKACYGIVVYFLGIC
jgi:hypothetical protein